MDEINVRSEIPEINGRTLSVLIKAEPGKVSFQRLIGKTISSLAESDPDGKTIDVILVFDKKSEIDKDLVGNKAGGIKIRYASGNGLKKKKTGRYIMKLDAGDIADGAKLKELIRYITERDNPVYVVPWTKKGKLAADEGISEFGSWKSVLTTSYRIILDPHCIAFRRELIEEPADLFENDLRASGAVIKAILAAEGYDEIKSGNIIHSDYSTSIDTTLRNDVIDDLIDYSMAKYGCVEDVLQGSLLSLFQNQLDKHGSKDNISKYIHYVSDIVIINRKSLNLRNRNYLLSIKYDREVFKEARIEDYGSVTYGDSAIGALRNLRVRIDVTEVEDGMITFEGRSDMHLLSEDYSLYMLASDGHRYNIELRPFSPFDKTGYDGEIYYRGMMFSITVPAGDNLVYRIYLEDGNHRRFLIRPGFSNYSKFIAGADIKPLALGGYHITYSNGEFLVRKNTPAIERRGELGILKYLIRKKKYAVAGYRVLSAIDRVISPKPVWIVADRPHVANDNGEHMFRYLQTTEEAKRSNVYFLIREDSPDYPRLRETGKVLKYGSHKHKIKFLRSNVILCAAANDLVINAMGNNGPYYRDLYKYDFVYLRHGVSHNDQSMWINKLGKNIRILVATCRPEYEGILNGDYDYTEREVRLTGLPRFDNLYDEKEKEILILPTWRKNLQGEIEAHSSEREYVESFVDSEYCKFYNALINDERLLNAMEKHGYKGTFYLHPVFEKQYGDFHSSRLITVGKGIADYQELFRKSAIMVTDYSSVAFDFAYLKKPVVYAQFDEAEFYKNHSWGKGYFTYREDGFGPITNTLEETVDELIYNIENDCRMRDEYVQKVEKFFAYTDRNNCRRVYEAIEEVERRKK